MGNLKRIAVIAAVLLLSGCATVSVEYSEAGGFKGTSSTLFKDVEAFSAEWGEVNVELGSSRGNLDQRLIACAIAPELCQ